MHEAEDNANEADTGSVLAQAWPDETWGRGDGTATYRSRGSPTASADRFLPAIATPLIRADGLMAWATAVRFLSFGRNELVATLADEGAKDHPPSEPPYETPRNREPPGDQRPDPTNPRGAGRDQQSRKRGRLESGKGGV